VENGRVELRGLGSSWNLGQELDSVGLSAEDVGDEDSGLRARATEGLERTGSRERWGRGSGAMSGKLRVSAGGEGSEREDGGRAIIGGGQLKVGSGRVFGRAVERGFGSIVGASGGGVGSEREDGGRASCGTAEGLC
jgi:hypothetical protein